MSVSAKTQTPRSKCPRPPPATYPTPARAPTNGTCPLAPPSGWPPLEMCVNLSPRQFHKADLKHIANEEWDKLELDALALSFEGRLQSVVRSGGRGLATQ